MAHGGEQYIAILRKVKNSALRYFYLNAEENTSFGTAGFIRTRQILSFFHIINSCLNKHSIQCKINVYFTELLQYFNASNDFLKQL